MEKARILNGKYAGTYSERWLEENQDIVFGGHLVSEWELTEVIPTGNYFDLSWDGSKWIEGATVEYRQELAENETTELIRSTRKYKYDLVIDHIYDKVILNIPIPNHVINQYNDIKEEFETKKTEIYSKYGIEN